MRQQRPPVVNSNDNVGCQMPQVPAHVIMAVQIAHVKGTSMKEDQYRQPLLAFCGPRWVVDANRNLIAFRTWHSLVLDALDWNFGSSFSASQAEAQVRAASLEVYCTQRSATAQSEVKVR